MPSARRALRDLQRSEIANKGEPPINLVPFIDILTVLVLYLLVGSVYEHLAILQLNLPSTAASATAETPPLQLTVTIRRTRLELSDGRRFARRYDNTPGGHNLGALSEALVDFKKKLPKETAITLLLEPNISYDALVQVMDAVRLWPAGAEAPAGVTELFPSISIGDAPKAAR